MWAGFADHSFWIAIGVSMKRMLEGYAISVVLGMILGLGVASSKFLEETMGGLLVSLQSLAQHLLAAAGGSLVRINRESYFVCSCDGIVALGHNRNGRWAETDAQDFRHGWT